MAMYSNSTHIHITLYTFTCLPFLCIAIHCICMSSSIAGTMELVYLVCNQTQLSVPSMVGSNNSIPRSWIPYNVVYGLMLKLEIYNYVAGRSLYTGGFPFLHWQLLLKLSTIQLSPELLQVMSFLKSSLIHFTCIGVVPIDWFRPLQHDKSRGSNSDADKMNQTQSRVFCSCHQLFRSHYMWVVNVLSEFYISITRTFTRIYRVDN